MDIILYPKASLINNVCFDSWVKHYIQMCSIRLPPLQLELFPPPMLFVIVPTYNVTLKYIRNSFNV